MGPAPKWHFVSKLPSGSLKIPTTGTPTTLGAHNFVCKTAIEMRFKGKVVALIGSFPRVCGTPPAHKGIRVILNFYCSGVKLAI
jgi:hypothetical protein